MIGNEINSTEHDRERRGQVRSFLYFTLPELGIAARRHVHTSEHQKLTSMIESIQDAALCPPNVSYKSFKV